VSAYGTITAISESPAMPGVVWAGTDDGNLQVSRDDGLTFTNVAANLPGLPASALNGATAYWISRVEASRFDPATAYVAVDGHRSDDLRPYIFVTHDYGRTFQNIAAALPPGGNVQVVREDPKNRNLLYAGTEFGLFISLDAGAHWEKFMNNYPTVRTDDIFIHPRDGDIIVASHGRSLWIADDITPLQQLTPALLSQDVVLFDVRSGINYLFDYRTDTDVGGDKRFEGENAPRGTAINYYLKSAATGPVTISITNALGQTLCTSTGPASAGIHRVQWTLVAAGVNAASGGRGGAGGATAPDASSCSGTSGGGRGNAAPSAGPGLYNVKLSVNGHDYTKPVLVLDDVWLHER
jgi:hypothetical protein